MSYSYNVSREAGTVLLAKFDDRTNEVVWIEELSPQQADDIARQMIEAVQHWLPPRPKPLTDAAIQEVKDYAGIGRRNPFTRLFKQGN